MASKSRAGFVTPWNMMKAREELIPRLFRCETLEPLGPRDSMTYFNNHKNIESSDMRITGYDRLHDHTPYDQSKPRCDRIKRDTIWREIHEENKLHKVAIITSHWHGRPNRVKLDFHDGKFGRTNEIRDDFYRRNGVDLL
ncbi:uncharacterized protein C5orf49-like [Venturia canescens]|uniref:uncharacterized protein C5orf49-like n=1 Tax=Venturia canescens TaxID=32260 RepID=UPI001C9C4098|nr:uncharacterized protein C5orf49-like [Venturia canescens]